MENKYDVEEYLTVWDETENGLEVLVNDNFELKEIDGRFYIIKKKSEYPKTYDECCEILSIPSYYKLRYYTYEHGYNEYTTLNKLCSLQDKLNAFSKLLICRDAYWRITGEEMGLDKSWEPDFTNIDEERYGIYTLANKVERDFCGTGDVNTILTFPTEEMRDIFYNNFKDTIETCKDLL